MSIAFPTIRVLYCSSNGRSERSPDLSLLSLVDGFPDGSPAVLHVGSRVGSHGGLLTESLTTSTRRRVSRQLARRRPFEAGRPDDKPFGACVCTLLVSEGNTLKLACWAVDYFRTSMAFPKFRLPYCSCNGTSERTLNLSLLSLVDGFPDS